MKSIEAIGFDMDYTLAQYKADTFESLAYVGTIQKLVHDLKYPSEVSFFFSGLIQFTIGVPLFFNFSCRIILGHEIQLAQLQF